MKAYVLETLNIWGGRVYEPLIEHITQQSKGVDIFCFQESLKTTSGREFTRPKEDIFPEQMSNIHPAHANIFVDFQKILTDYQSIFHSVQDKMDYRGHTDYDLEFGQAMFIKNSLPIFKSGDVFVYRNKNSFGGDDWLTVGRNIEYIEVEINGKHFLICNFHGVHGGEKRDTPDRIEQAKKVKEFLESFSGPKIICGDFNLLPDTESMGIIERGMKNLVKEYSVTSTRSHFYEKEARFADYILVSEDIEVNRFRVLDDLVSDHLALQVEFS